MSQRSKNVRYFIIANTKRLKINNQFCESKNVSTVTNKKRIVRKKTQKI